MSDRGYPMKKQPEVTEKTRNAIVDTFCAMYENMPIEKIFVKDLIERAGYNRSTFYQYFSDIYALLDYVENNVIETIRSRMGEKGTTATQLMDFFEQNELYLKALLGTNGNIHFMDRLKKELVQYLDVRLPEVNEQIKPYVMEHHMSTTVSLFRLWIARGKDISQEELFQLIHILYHDGYLGLIKEKKYVE